MEPASNSPTSCRLCDKTSPKMYSIFDKTEDGQQILCVIKQCLPVIIYRSDPLSKLICQTCLTNLDIITNFKKISKETSERQKGQLSNNSNENADVQLFLDCQMETDDSELMEPQTTRNKSTSTEDLSVLCINCKQAIVDANAVNGEIELCTDLHKVLTNSLCKPSQPEQETETEKLLRSKRRKSQAFYHELEDSLCSSLTEFTNNTESSQGAEFQSDLESMDSDADGGQRAKRRKLDDEQEGDENGLMIIKLNVEKKKAQSLMNSFKNDVEYRYQPFTLLRLTLNVINKQNLPGYKAPKCLKEAHQPRCKVCQQKCNNYKLLAVHELAHIDVDLGDKIDKPMLWGESREDADIRNKWLNYFDENGYEEDDIIIDSSEKSLLIPLEDKVDTEFKGTEHCIVLVGTQAMVNGKPLSTYSKEERKSFYRTMRIGGANKKYCQLCRYIFKDNWAIESHYFSFACYYTCRYCGLRFNKQRQLFDEHVNVHEKKGDVVVEKIYTANRLNNVVPKRTHGGNSKGKSAIASMPIKPEVKPERISARMLQVQVKEEKEAPPPLLDSKEMLMTSQGKTGNQAYFCRKCYKVFFKLDEFKVHSRNCDYNQFPAMRQPGKTNNKSNGNDISPSGRPVRHCVKEQGAYKDDAYLSEPPTTPPGQAFVCFVCSVPFPTIYSRNSHMRIHKNDPEAAALKAKHKAKQLEQLNNEPVQVKQEPLEPMVEIHESEQNFSSSIGSGAVSITPISKNPNQKAVINPNIMKLVQANPNITIKKPEEKYVPPAAATPPSASQAGSPNDPDRSYKCSSCWEAFSNKSHLYFHKKNQCQGSRFPCPFCKKRFGTEAAYSSHIFYSHPE